MTNTMDLTPTQSRMMAILEDGRQHTPEELHTCLMDDLGAVTNVQIHLSSIRKIIRPLGYDIQYEQVNGGRYYRKVRLISRGE